MTKANSVSFLGCPTDHHWLVDSPIKLSPCLWVLEIRNPRPKCQHSWCQGLWESVHASPAVFCWKEDLPEKQVLKIMLELVFWVGLIFWEMGYSLLVCWYAWAFSQCLCIILPFVHIYLCVQISVVFIRTLVLDDSPPSWPHPSSAKTVFPNKVTFSGTGISTLMFFWGDITTHNSNQFVI